MTGLALEAVLLPVLLAPLSSDKVFSFSCDALLLWPSSFGTRIMLDLMLSLSCLHRSFSLDVSYARAP